MRRYIPAAAGLVFAALVIGAMRVRPGVDAHGDVVVSYLAQHSGQLRTQALMVAAGTLALVIVLGYARNRLEGPTGHVFTIGSAIMLVGTSMQCWLWLALARGIDLSEPESIRPLAISASAWGPVVAIADVMVAVPIAVAAAQRRFPSWVGVVAMIFAFYQLVETFSELGDSGPFTSPAGLVNINQGGLLLILLFVPLGFALVEPRHTQPHN